MFDKPGESIKCSNCNTTVTPLWRRSADGDYVCNACGLYYKIHKSHRPRELKSDSFRQRQRYKRSESHMYFPERGHLKYFENQVYPKLQSFIPVFDRNNVSYYSGYPGISRCYKYPETYYMPHYKPNNKCEERSIEKLVNMRYGDENIKEEDNESKGQSSTEKEDELYAIQALLNLSRRSYES